MDNVKIIVNGPSAELFSLREELAAVLRRHGWEVTEKGLPKPGRNLQHVMYLTGKRIPPRSKPNELLYVDLEEGA